MTIYTTKHAVSQAQMRCPGRLCDSKEAVGAWIIAEAALAFEQGRRSATTPR